MGRKSEDGAGPRALPPTPRIDPSTEHYPFCIVWAPIPILSWILPFVGHVGICDSVGRIFDFEGPYKIGVDSMLFGNPVKYWDISEMYAPTLHRSSGAAPRTIEEEEARQREAREYDDAVENVANHFRKTQVYNFFTNNCHSFVASVLRSHPLSGAGSWGMVRVAFGLATRGRYISTGRFLKAHLPFLVLVVVAVLLCILAR
ncbi:transmembrane protein 222 [Trypanosoma rangeli]|uniref:Transmembrane protein 222 n=1 Tax=Trypanosoma rangeli TaxID=5698 RepID=A0A422NWL7_TRYRA|nr:transmembrane protein 222 [Trypanosoma rangeli]RNF09839.1 transmembrane protein 222 [Trypanosoma rangeli]|eukprot:RNF09839.1 transmembrane protein 222 [Trypanosoma rangeli]